jgi:probable HAF family extracellular repeat protein
MNRMIRHVGSTLGTAFVLCAFALTLPNATSADLDSQNRNGADRHGRDPHPLTFVQIDFPGATHTEAYGINNRGQIVGFYVDAMGAQHGFSWTRASSL